MSQVKSEVKPYDPQENKKSQISRMFNSIAPYYDLLNRVLSLGIDKVWRRKAIRLLQPDQPQMILDVATGTADVALEIAKQLKPKKIIGIDISVDMLSIGRDKIKNKNLHPLIELQEGDSENLPFEDNTFDAVTVAFGVRNFENLDKGLSEIRRVLKEDGQLVVLEFSRPNIFPFKQLFNFYFKNILPFIGRMTSKDPKAYRYLYESVQAFPDGTDFIEVLSKNDFKSHAWTPLTLGICSIYSARK